MMMEEMGMTEWLFLFGFFAIPAIVGGVCVAFAGAPVPAGLSIAALTLITEIGVCTFRD